MEYRYSISHRLRLVDSEPMERHETPLVWNAILQKWEKGGLTFGEHMDSVPVTDEEAAQFMKDGIISENTKRRMTYEMPDPWDESLRGRKSRRRERG